MSDTVQQQVTIIAASTPEHVRTARELFIEYQQAIGVDLYFQGFEQELAGLPGDYAPPDGQLLLAMVGGQVAGCVALRRFSDGVSEMKRMYVRPAFKGKRIGRAMAVELIRRAREIGYSKMRLDTLPFMKEAIALYRSLGFKDIGAYRLNPVEGTVYLELDLRGGESQ